MSCETITSGISVGCDKNMGGVFAIYIADLANVSSLTASGGTISGVTMATGSFHSFEFNKNSASYEENELINNENGSAYVEQKVMLTIPRRDVAKRNVIKMLALRKVAIIVKDGNGLYWYLGEDNGMLLSEHTGGSGAAREEGSKYILTFTGEELELSQLVTEAAVLAVI